MYRKKIPPRVFWLAALALSVLPLLSHSTEKPHTIDYSLTKGEVVPIAAKKARLPLNIFAESPGMSASYVPSGYMGDASAMKVTAADFSAPLDSSSTGRTTLRVQVKPEGREGWAGLYFQTPANNWGKIKGAGYDLSAAKKLTFWARGENGGEKIAEIKMGGLIGPYPDTDSAAIGPLRLNKEWTPYTIDLRDHDLRHIVGGFAFSVRRSDNPRGAVFYLDEIRFEGDVVASTPAVTAVPAETPLASTATAVAPSPIPAQPKLTKPIKIIVPFLSAKTAFTPEAREAIDEIAGAALKAPEARVFVDGHTDNVGPKPLNKKLSLERARAVADYLIGKGVSRDRITIAGHGDEDPVREGANDTAQGRMENRRVEVTLSPQ